MNDVLVAREQVRYEQKAYWRNPMAAFFTFMFPVVFLVVVGTSAGSFRVPGTTLRYDQYVVVAMLVFGLIGACYTNLAMTICLRRDNGMLKRMRGTPISIGSYMAGIIGSVIINVAILAVIVVGIGMLFYHLHFPYHLVGGPGDLGGRDRDVLCARSGCDHPRDQRRRRPGGDQRDLPPDRVHLRRLLPRERHPSVLSKIADVFPVRHMVTFTGRFVRERPGLG